MRMLFSSGDLVDGLHLCVRSCVVAAYPAATFAVGSLGGDEEGPRRRQCTGAAGTEGQAHTADHLCG